LFADLWHAKMLGDIKRGISRAKYLGLVAFVNQINLDFLLSSRRIHLPVLVALIACGFMFAPLPSEGALVSLRSDGGLVVDGEAFFPLGIYHVSWLFSADQLPADLAGMAALGCNTIHASYTEGDFESFLDAAQARHIYVIVEGYWNQARPGSWLTSFKGHPAILGWSIGDDVHDDLTPDQLRARRDAVRALDPNHPTFYTVYNPKRWAGYLDVGDVLLPYNYPVGNSWLGEVNYILSLARAQSPLPIWGVPQAFAWPNKPAPTAVQYRNMVYQTLINGAKGLLGYTFRDGENYLPSHPELADSVKAVNAELRFLGPVFLDGTREKLCTGTRADEEGLQAALWNCGEICCLVVLNTSETSVRSCALSLPTGYKRSLKPVFSTGPRGLVLNPANQTVTGELQPRDVHVYFLN
jgi:hypothetical protein